ncbi:GMC family oxidoreductase N-terminal domain-containing protein [candidate division KSB1 bacterium]|nr:GMC family oxidoreductase N-terminal domain-containing protein [candidate division KSB1 bacterium]
MKKKAIVIGSGAGGATAARELQGTYDVTILEAGRPFRPFTGNISLFEKFKWTGLFFDEREIKMLFPFMRIQKAADKMALVSGIGTGGTTTICTGNALRMDHDLKKMGIDLDPEFKQIYKEIPVSSAHQQHWKPVTRRLFEICKKMELNPLPTTKMGHYEKCTGCGRCVFGCPYGVKWDSRQFLNDAVSKGAQLITNCTVRNIVFENGKASGVMVKMGQKKVIFRADVIIVAAGGFGTPLILQNSGIPCESGLFVDPVLCVAAEWQNAGQNKQVSMPFIVQREHFMISPYFDYLSFFFNNNWRYPAGNILSLMIKLADTNTGSINNKKIYKKLTDQDKQQLRQAVELCTEIFSRLGVKKQNLFLGTLNAGHPGGMLPLTENERDSLHPAVLPENVWVADATLIPKSLGNPPIFTIIALAKRVSKNINNRN